MDTAIKLPISTSADSVVECFALSTGAGFFRSASE